MSKKSMIGTYIAYTIAALISLSIILVTVGWLAYMIWALLQ